MAKLGDCTQAVNHNCDLITTLQSCNELGPTDVKQPAVAIVIGETLNFQFPPSTMLLLKILHE